MENYVFGVESRPRFPETPLAVVVFASEYRPAPETCSHGVLKAILSGMMTAYLIAQILCRGANASKAAQSYSVWVRRWFVHDVAGLRDLYIRLAKSPRWLRASRHPRASTGTRCCSKDGISKDAFEERKWDF